MKAACKMYRCKCRWKEQSLLSLAAPKKQWATYSLLSNGYQVTGRLYLFCLTQYGILGHCLVRTRVTIGYKLLDKNTWPPNLIDKNVAKWIDHRDMIFWILPNTESSISCTWSLLKDCFILKLTKKLSLSIHSARALPSLFFDRRITSGLWNWHMAGKFDLYIVGRYLNICSKTPSVLNCKIIFFSTVSRFFIHGVMKLSCFVTFWPLWDRVVPWLDCAVGPLHNKHEYLWYTVDLDGWKWGWMKKWEWAGTAGQHAGAAGGGGGGGFFSFMTSATLWDSILVQEPFLCQSVWSSLYANVGKFKTFKRIAISNVSI